MLFVTNIFSFANSLNSSKFLFGTRTIFVKCFLLWLCHRRKLPLCSSFPFLPFSVLLFLLNSYKILERRSSSCLHVSGFVLILLPLTYHISRWVIWTKMNNKEWINIQRLSCFVESFSILDYRIMYFREAQQHPLFDNLEETVI